VLDVDQRGVGRLRGVIERLRCGVASGVLGGGDDLESLTLEILVNLLPTWQVESAPSP
jgi:hypothetical protein